MKNKFQKIILNISFCVLGSGFIIPAANAQTPKLALDFSKPGANVGPMLYGLITEEINHS